MKIQRTIQYVGLGIAVLPIPIYIIYSIVMMSTMATKPPTAQLLVGGIIHNIVPFAIAAALGYGIIIRKELVRQIFIFLLCLGLLGGIWQIIQLIQMNNDPMMRSVLEAMGGLPMLSAYILVGFIVDLALLRFFTHKRVRQQFY